MSSSTPKKLPSKVPPLDGTDRFTFTQSTLASTPSSTLKSSRSEQDPSPEASSQASSEAFCTAPGFAPGDRVYFAGGSIELPGGHRLSFGLPGLVVGPSDGEHAQPLRDVVVCFKGFPPRGIEVPRSQVLRCFPEIPGGYQRGQHIRYTGGYLFFPGGDSLSFGQRGEVVGCSAVEDGIDQQRIQVKFEGNTRYINVYLWQTSQDEPVFPGGYSLGDTVYYIGGRMKFLNGDRLHYGLRGEVCGVPVEEGRSSRQRLQVRFSGNQAYTNVLLSHISRKRLKIPGGYSVGSRVVYAGENWSIGSRHLSSGAGGVVVGRSTRGDDQDDHHIKVRFDNFRDYVNVPLAHIAASPPNLGSIAADEIAYYSGGAMSFPNGDRLQFGMPGKIMDESMWRAQQHMLVHFDGNLSATNVPASHISRTPPKIPGDFSAGEYVYYIGGPECFPDGSQLDYGLQGMVVGCSTPAPGEHHVEVQFEANDTYINTLPWYLARDRPVLPQGYTVGNDVFYTGNVTYFPHGDRLIFGLHGHVVGRSTVGDGEDDQRIKVLFDNHINFVDVFVSEVSNSPPVDPNDLNVGDAVYYSGPDECLADGFQLSFGLPGRIVARCTLGDGNDECVEVLFDGCEDCTAVLFQRLSRIPPAQINEWHSQRSRTASTEETRTSSGTSSLHTRSSVDTRTSSKTSSFQTKSSIETFTSLAASSVRSSDATSISSCFASVGSQSLAAPF